MPETIQRAGLGHHTFCLGCSDTVEEHLITSALEETPCVVLLVVNIVSF